MKNSDLVHWFSITSMYFSRAGSKTFFLVGTCPSIYLLLSSRAFFAPLLVPRRHCWPAAQENGTHSRSSEDCWRMNSSAFQMTAPHWYDRQLSFSYRKSWLGHSLVTLLYLLPVKVHLTRYDTHLSINSFSMLLSFFCFSDFTMYYSFGITSVNWHWSKTKIHQYKRTRCHSKYRKYCWSGRTTGSCSFPGLHQW